MKSQPDTTPRVASNLSVLLRVLVPGLLGAAVIVFYHPGAMDMDRLKWSLILAAGLIALGVTQGRGLIGTVFSPLSPALFMAALVPAFLLLSCFRTGAPSFEEARLLIGLLVLIVVASVVRDGVWARPRVIPGLLLAAGSLAALLGVIQSSGIEFLYKANEGAEAVSTLGNTNAAAEVFALLLPLAAAGLFSSSRTASVFSGACLVLLAAGLTATGGRGGLIAAFCGLAALVILLIRNAQLRGAENERPWKPLAWSSFAGLALLLAIGAGGALIVRSAPTEPFKNIETDASVFSPTYPTNKVRLSLWSGTIDMIGDHPLLGTGPGRFRYAYAAYRDPEEARIRGRLGAVTEVENPHNEFLWAAAEGGLCAAGALALALLLFLRQGIAATAAARERRHALFSAALSGTVVAFGVLCMVRAPLHNPAAATILFIAAGMIDSTRYELGIDRSSSLARTVTGALGAAAVLALAFLGANSLRSDLIFATVGTAETTTPAELDALDRALSIDDGNIELVNFRGQIAAQVAWSMADGRNAYQDDAARFLGEVLRRHPSHPGALRTLARIKLIDGNLRAGVRMLSRALRLIGSDEDPVQTAARYLEAENLHRSAARLLIEFSSTDDDTILAKASALLDAGRAREAALYADALLEKKPLHVDGLHLKARCLRTLVDGSPGGERAVDEIFGLMQAVIGLEYLEAGNWAEAAKAAARSARYSASEEDGTAPLLGAIAAAAQGGPFEPPAAPVRSTAMRTRLKALGKDSRLPGKVRSFLRDLSTK